MGGSGANGVIGGIGAAGGVGAKSGVDNAGVNAEDLAGISGVCNADDA